MGKINFSKCSKIEFIDLLAHLVAELRPSFPYWRGRGESRVDCSGTTGQLN